MSKVLKKITAIMLTLAMVVTICPQGKLISIKAADAEDNTPYNLSNGRPAYASSQTGSGSAAELAVDNDESTRWQAKQDDTNEWLYVDLGKEADIDHIYLRWEAAYAKYYQIQISNNEDDWTTIYEKGNKPGAFVNMAFSYEVNKFNTEKNLYEVSAKWTPVENAVYSVYEGDKIVQAPDNFKFDKIGQDGGNLGLTEGTHELEVRAYNKDNPEQLVGSAKCTVEVKADGKGNNGVEIDETAKLKQTISKEELSSTKA